MTTDRPQFRQLDTYRCVAGSFPILAIETSVISLAESLGFYIQSLIEPGLGGQRGFILEMASGIVLSVLDYVERPDLGVEILADGADIARVGSEQLESQAEELLCLDQARVTWRKSAASEVDK